MENVQNSTSVRWLSSFFSLTKAGCSAEGSTLPSQQPCPGWLVVPREAWPGIQGQREGNCSPKEVLPLCQKQACFMKRTVELSAAVLCKYKAERRKSFIGLYWSSSVWTVVTPTKTSSSRSNTNVTGITETYSALRYRLFQEDVENHYWCFLHDVGVYEYTKSITQQECLLLTATATCIRLFWNPFLDWKVYSGL